MVEETFEVGEPEPGESVLVGDEDAAVLGIAHVVEEGGESASILVGAAPDIGVGGFDRPSVIVCVLGETVELAVEVTVFFLTVTADAGVEGDSVALAVVAGETEEFAAGDATVAAGGAGVVEVVAAIPAFD